MHINTMGTAARYRERIVFLNKVVLIEIMTTEIHFFTSKKNKVVFRYDDELAAQHAYNMLIDRLGFEF